MRRGQGAAVAPPQQRSVQAQGGPLRYTLTRKRVRNLNLRIHEDGSLAVSAPPRMPLFEVDRFVASRAAWVEKHRRTLATRPAPVPCTLSRAACLALFTRVSDAVFPLFSGVLEGQKPTLRLREMKTRWGSCNPKTRTITLNTRLAEKPLAAVEYVVLHEYVHFLHPNHQPAFHAEMARLMPDYKQRRKLLR